MNSRALFVLSLVFFVVACGEKDKDTAQPGETGPPTETETPGDTQPPVDSKPETGDSTTDLMDADGDGYLEDVDCDDSDPEIYPGAGDKTRSQPPGCPARPA